ncbi:MAG: MFS transporter, partial [Microbacteriaceae bacterium]
MKYTFRSLRFFNYRVWAAGAIVSNTGTWMQRVAQDWLVLTVLTANSSIALGVTTGLQFGPILVLAPLAGVISDRYNKRIVLMITQSSAGVISLGLGILVLGGHAQLWHVYVLALLSGVVAAIDSPARQTFVTEMVPLKDLPNAVGLNSASFNAARLIGPGAAGLLIAGIGIGWVFVINAATFLAVVFSLTRMREADLSTSAAPKRGKGAMRAGMRYVRNRPDIMLILVVIGLVGAFGINFQMTTAIMARLVFDKGAADYGLLGSIMAVGSLAGALLAARRDHPSTRLVVGSALVFGAFSAIAALMPTFWTFAIALIPVGLSALTLLTTANATVQMTVAPAMRGRVMALYMAIFMGTTPIGAPLVGWIGEAWGPRWTLLFGGLVSMAAAAAAILFLMRVNKVRFGYDAATRLRFGLVPT